MTQVRIKIGPRTYSIACGPGDEEKVEKFGRLIDENYAKLGTARAAQEADNLVFAALFMADELDEARTAINNASLEIGELKQKLQRAEDDLAMAVAADRHVGRLDEVEVTAVPQVRLDDPPFADERAFHHSRHGGAPSNLGSRIKL